MRQDSGDTERRGDKDKLQGWWHVIVGGLFPGGLSAPLRQKPAKFLLQSCKPVWKRLILLLFFCFALIAGNTDLLGPPARAAVTHYS